MTITYEVVPGGSGNGVTSALKRMRCPRMAWYDEREKATNTRMRGGGTFCGTLAHAFVEIYTSHDANFDPLDVTFVPKEGYTFPDDFAVQHEEAVRMFEAYRKRFSPTLGGKLIAAEREFKLRELTAKLDGIYTFEDEKNELKAPPGTYIVDYKFLGKFGPSDAEAYVYSAQSAWYQHIARANGVEIDGAYFVCGIKTKVPRFEIVRATKFSEEALNELIARMEEKPNQQRSYQCTSQYGNCAYMKECLGV